MVVGLLGGASSSKLVCAAAVGFVAMLAALRFVRSGGGRLLGDVDAFKQVVIIVRHGDRHDYADPAWKERLVGGRPFDPPLSNLGHFQAQELGAAVFEALRGRRTRILTSPYLRCVQTAQPMAQLMGAGARVEVDERLAEVRHNPAFTATAAAHFQTFPSVVDAEDGAPRQTDAANEGWPVPYLARMRSNADAFTARLAASAEDTSSSNEALVLVGHAASVAMVYAFLGDTLTPDHIFAPAGAYVLGRNGPQDRWTLLRSGASNEPYVTNNAPTTHPWGFKPNELRIWREANKDRAPFPAGAPEE